MQDIIAPNAFVDYVKFVFTGGFDNLQQYIAPAWETVAANAQGRGIYRGGQKFRALPGTNAAGDTRYTFEAWGQMAEFFYRHLPTAWLCQLYRLDLRQELPGLSADHVRAIQTAISLGNKGRVNTYLMNTRDRHKSHQRDVGGLGITFGSRKSDQHAVLYKRSSEAVAFEYRLQGKLCNKDAKNTFIEWQNDEVEDARAELISRAIGHRMMFLHRALGHTTLEGLVKFANDSLERTASMLKALDFIETKEEANYWEALPAEEQEQLQRETWFPTGIRK